MLSTKEELEALLRTLDVWVIIFGVLVAIGVAGESIVGFIHFRKTSQLHRLQTAENLAQQAEIERLRNESASIRAGTAHAEQQAAESNKIAEEERLARVKIEERLASRRISSNYHSAFVAALKPFAGSIVEITKLGDFEAGQFADEIISVFAAAGWNRRLTTVGVYSPPTYGVVCSINETSPAGKALAAILGKLPNVQIRSAPELSIVATIFVGLRPPP